MPRETRLYWALRSRGLDVEYVPGWTTRGSANFAPFGDLAHWTAGARTGDRPSLNVCIYGRKGLPGPLCNVFGPRGLTPDRQKVILVAAGRANHAGAGLYRGADGNSDLFGTEMEWSGGAGELTAWQRYAYPRIHATYRDLGSKFTAGHDEFALPRGRKVDIGKEIDWLRGEIDNILRQPPRDPRSTTVIDLKPKPAPTPQEDPLMAISAQEIGKAVAESIRTMFISDAPDAPGHMGAAVYRTQSELMRLTDQVANLGELTYAVHVGDDAAATEAIEAIRDRRAARPFLQKGA